MLEYRKDTCVIAVRNEGSELCFDRAPYCKKRARVSFQYSPPHVLILCSFLYCPVVGAVCPGAMWRKAQKSLRKALAVFFMI